MNIIKKIKTGGRKKYIGICFNCNADQTSRWYRRNNSAICKKCYDYERRLNPKIRQKRLKQRHDWEIKNPYKSAKNMAKHKKQFFDLTEEEYLKIISLNCHYCNNKLNKSGIRLDRKENNHPYTKNNVVPCCKICNVAKNNMNYNEFKNWIEQVFITINNKL